MNRIIEELTAYINSKGLKIVEGSASSEELLYLQELTKKTKSRLIGEIGFNAGFSSYAFLQVDHNVNVISFDIGDYKYIQAAKDFIDDKFPGRHKLIIGDSKNTVPKFATDNPKTTFDLVFIDGGHDYKTAKADILNMKNLSKKDTPVVMDDITPWLPWGKGPTKAWLEMIDNGVVSQKELYKDGKPVKKIKPPGKRSWALGKYIL